MSHMNTDVKLSAIGNAMVSQAGWNKKMCFEARDTLFACAEQQENQNKFRCPDELYAYEMWCPKDFRRIHSHLKRKEDMQNEMYDKQQVDTINSQRALVTVGRYVKY